jgi:serine/threonine protein kinase
VKVKILIDQDGHARLASFRLAGIDSLYEEHLTWRYPFPGNVTPWKSPELLWPTPGEPIPDDFGNPTKESERYALGMVIYEALTGERPFAPLGIVPVWKEIGNGARPKRPEGVKGTLFTDELWKMLSLCWAAKPEDRPSLKAVHECLEQVSTTWKPLPL